MSETEINQIWDHLLSEPPFKVRTGQAAVFCQRILGCLKGRRGLENLRGYARAVTADYPGEM